ncbi:MAG: GNAT family N-acetyltransferase [Chloroflexi bacterium]|nr:GNAT family N-acetyltransferase [Chloroflexota bacterium]
MVEKTLPRITIRAIRDEDIDGIFAVDGRVGGATRGITFAGPISDYLGKASGMGCVARAGEDVIGLIMGRVVRPFPGCQSGAWIEVVGVAPEYRRGGVATRLFKAFQEQCRKRGIACLHALTATNEKNLAGFLASVGFSAGNHVKWDKQI